MQNQAMRRKIDTEEAVDLSENERNDEGDYILTEFEDDKDYCDSKTESWIWSIGKDNATGEVLASMTTKFYINEQYECLFLR